MQESNHLQIIHQYATQSHSEIRDHNGNTTGWLLHSGFTMAAIVTSIILLGAFSF